jgi:uncharacterized protein (DUF924 family)
MDTWVEDVLQFWFVELRPESWFAKNADLDAKIRDRFASLHERLSNRELPIPDRPRAFLAAVIVLDQFSRNLFRNSPRAFDSDSRALDLSQCAIAKSYDAQLTPSERHFIYMPFMHSEDIHVQARAVELFASLQESEATRYAIEHRDIIERFGRFPHRNAVLGRTSSAEELEFMREHAGF